MALKIIVEPLDDPLSTMSHELDQSLVTVGRSKSCHLELDHPEISRRHFIVKFEETGYVLLDENSRHGTVLDKIKLEPQKAYPLGRDHEIEVPGFRIRLMCDGERPRLERTTVVARQLLDDLLQGDIRPREVPSLRSSNANYHFKFVEEKTTFVLGSLPHVDFVVPDEHVAKKHVSFIRDIFGIRIVPTPGNDVLVDNAPVTVPQILKAGAIIKIGELELIYTESDAHEIKTIVAAPAAVEEQKKEELPKTVEPKAQPQNKPKTVITALDRVFILGFVAVCLGAVLILVNLM